MGMQNIKGTGLDWVYPSKAPADAKAGKDGDCRADRSMNWLEKFAEQTVSATESFIDPGDAVPRRRKSDKIYKALIAEQISLQRAAAELKAITARQKGGWLSQSIKRRGLPLVSAR